MATPTVLDPDTAYAESEQIAARGLIRRPRVVALLADPSAPPLALLIAPAGYGKTTVLREWAKRDRRRFAWLTLDERDNDPARLLDSMNAALAAIGPDGITRPFVLAIDDAHVIERPSARRMLAALVDAPHGNATLVIAGHRVPGLPVARLRAQRMVLELGPRELAMTRSEAAAFFRLNETELDAAAVDVLLRRTEGWPVGISLAALCLGQRPAPAAVARFGGRDRIVAEYVHDEVLADLTPEQLRFATRTSILETLTAPLCDAVLVQSRSAAVLAEIAASGTLLVPLDRTGEVHRHHHLVQDALRAELRCHEPELERILHRRAAAWHRRNGDVDRALAHSLAAGDVDRAGALVAARLGPCLQFGRDATLARWLDQFSDAQVTSDPALCIAAAGHHLIRGRGDLAEHWASRAAAAGAGSRWATAGPLAALRAAIGRDGLARMRADAEGASALLPTASPWRAACALLGAVADHLSGARAAASRGLEQGARQAAVPAPNVHALCLAQLAILAIEDGDWEDAMESSTRARAQIERHGLGDDVTMALVFAVSAVVCGHRGRVEDASRDAAQAQTLAAGLTDFAPWYEIELDILLARSALRLSDLNGARALLGRAERLQRHALDAPVLEHWLRDAAEQVDAFAAGTDTSAPRLTTAELRILGFLPTHLSFREIADRTYVSANTVKTQANAVYRKLDVTSRSEAVTRATALGLLDT